MSNLNQAEVLRNEAFLFLLFESLPPPQPNTENRKDMFSATNMNRGRFCAIAGGPLLTLPSRLTFSVEEELKQATEGNAEAGYHLSAHGDCMR